MPVLSSTIFLTIREVFTEDLTKIQLTFTRKFQLEFSIFVYKKQESVLKARNMRQIVE